MEGSAPCTLLLGSSILPRMFGDGQVRRQVAQTRLGLATLTPRAGPGFSRVSRSVQRGSGGVRASLAVLWRECTVYAFYIHQVMLLAGSFRFSPHFTNKKIQETGVWDFQIKYQT